MDRGWKIAIVWAMITAALFFATLWMEYAVVPPA
jgi:hypothetical protein